MAAIHVTAGTRLMTGEPIGEAMAGLHVGFRLHGRYVDPATVFSAATHAVLVPIPGG